PAPVAARCPDPRPAAAPAQPARSRSSAERRPGVASQRSPRKTTLLILAAAVVAAVVLFSGGGSSGKASSTASTLGSTTVGKTKSTARHKAPSKSSKSSAHAANPAETIVTVLNGTETAGLAHRVSGQLQQRGYSQAAALSGSPSGTHPVTVVQYASGHQ